MKRGLVSGLAVALALSATAGTARAQDEAAKVSEWLSGNVAVASDYAFRGISQTLEEPAIQGGMDLEHPSGLYLGFWGSSVNFGEDLAAGPRAQAEMDVYGGFGFSAAQILDVDLGAIYYAYPGSDGRGYDFIEYGIGASRSLSLLDAGVSLAYSPDYFGESGEAFYYGADVSVPVSLLTISGSLGHQTIDRNEIFGTPDYTNFGLGVGVGVAGFDLSGQWVDTDLEEDECFGGSDLCSSRFIFGISRAL
jgi:uncharacterized protein (TIGR02001 family)